MSREVDRRDFTVNKVTPAREAELRSRAADISDRLPGASDQDRKFRCHHGQPRGGSFGIRAGRDRQLHSARPESRAAYQSGFGPGATQPAEFVADLHIRWTTSGAVAVHLQQQYKGIPLFQAAETVRFAPDGVLQETVGSRVTVAWDVPVAPRLSVEEAVRRGAEHVAVPQLDEQGAVDPFGEPLQLPSVK